MTTNTTTPQVWIGCLNAYNCGHLHGEWTDATLGVEALQEAAERVLKTSPGDGICEEIFLADNEGFGDLIGEYTPLATVAELAEAIEEHGPAFIAYAGLGRHADDDVFSMVEGFQDAYHGEAESEKDYAENYVAECGWAGACPVPDEMFAYLDFDMIARELFMDYTYVRADGTGYVFGP